MSENKLAVLFKAPKCLELYIFDSPHHCLAEIKAFIEFEKKTALEYIYFEERVKSSKMIAEEFSSRYPELHRGKKFQNFAYSSWKRYPFYRWEILERIFKNYFSFYKDSLSR